MHCLRGSVTQWKWQESHFRIMLALRVLLKDLCESYKCLNRRVRPRGGGRIKSKDHENRCIHFDNKMLDPTESRRNESSNEEITFHFTLSPSPFFFLHLRALTRAMIIDRVHGGVAQRHFRFYSFFV